MEFGLTCQIIQDNADRVHSTVPLSLLMRNHLLLRGNDAAQPFLVERFEETRLIVEIDSKIPFDVVSHRLPFWREGVGAEHMNASVSAPIPVQEPGAQPSGFARKGRRHKQTVSNSCLWEAWVL